MLWWILSWNTGVRRQIESRESLGHEVGSHLRHSRGWSFCRKFPGTNGGLILARNAPTLAALPAGAI